MTAPFYNSTGITGDALKKAVASAISCEAAVWQIYRDTRQKFTPWQVHGMIERAGLRYTKSSVGRSITNLRNAGDLQMLTEMRTGPHGASEHYYVINKSKHPSQQPKQGDIWK